MQTYDLIQFLVIYGCGMFEFGEVLYILIFFFKLCNAILKHLMSRLHDFNEALG